MKQLKASKAEQTPPSKTTEMKIQQSPGHLKSNIIVYKASSKPEHPPITLQQSHLSRSSAVGQQATIQKVLPATYQIATTT
jgi:hypothetical protein